MILTKYKPLIMIGIFILSLCGFYVLHSQREAIETQQTEIELEEIFNEKEEVVKTEAIEEKVSKVVVDLKGAVLKPGVYEMEEGERVIDVIEKAGGLEEEADQKNVNLALYLKDEMVIYIPVIGEEGYQLEQQTVGDSEGKINLNNATSDELQTIPGVGPSKASQILAFREQNGHFKNVEDLMNVTGIGEKSFEKMKEFIYVR